MNDHSHMRAALALARRGWGSTWPNPSVGCVLVREGRVVGRGHTAPGGRPHAETEALRRAGALARGATAYVTLEPCAHHGQTPPCAEALVAAGVIRVVIASPDPDPRVNGRGVGILRAAGVEVVEGVLAEEGEEVHAGFLSRVRRGRPLLTLKLATTLDGRIATRTGESQWITGTAARRAAHAMRGEHDAVLVGAGTVASDNPDLTCRIPGFSPRSLLRVVADSHLRTALTARVVMTAAAAPTAVLHRDGADPARLQAFRTAGVTLHAVPAASPGVDLAAGLQVLGSMGVTRLLAEGGARIAAALLRLGLVDRIAWFHAPAVMGGDGLPAAAGFGADLLAALPRFHRVRATPIGEDMLTELRLAA